MKTARADCKQACGKDGAATYRTHLAGIMLNRNQRDWFTKKETKMEAEREDPFKELGYTGAPPLKDVAPAPQDTTPKWVLNWRRIYELAQAVNSQGGVSSQKAIGEALSLPKNDVTAAVSGAKRKFPEEWAEFYRLIGKKPIQRGPRAVDEEETDDDPNLQEDQPGDIETEEVSEADVAAHLINLLEGFPKNVQTRLVATACVFHGLDFASLSGDQLVTSRPSTSKPTASDSGSPG